MQFQGFKIFAKQVKVKFCRASVTAGVATSVFLLSAPALAQSVREPIFGPLRKDFGFSLPPAVAMPRILLCDFTAEPRPPDFHETLLAETKAWHFKAKKIESTKYLKLFTPYEVKPLLYCLLPSVKAYADIVLKECQFFDEFMTPLAKKIGLDKTVLLNDTPNMSPLIMQQLRVRAGASLSDAAPMKMSGDFVVERTFGGKKKFFNMEIGVSISDRNKMNDMTPTELPDLPDGYRENIEALRGASSFGVEMDWLRQTRYVPLDTFLPRDELFSLITKVNEEFVRRITLAKQPLTVCLDRLSKAVLEQLPNGESVPFGQLSPRMFREVAEVCVRNGISLEEMQGSSFRIVRSSIDFTVGLRTKSGRSTTGTFQIH